jgi:hypothetical protein
MLCTDFEQQRVEPQRQKSKQLLWLIGMSSLCSWQERRRPLLHRSQQTDAELRQVKAHQALQAREHAEMLEQLLQGQQEAGPWMIQCHGMRWHHPSQTMIRV